MLIFSKCLVANSATMMIALLSVCFINAFFVIVISKSSVAASSTANDASSITASVFVSDLISGKRLQQVSDITFTKSNNNNNGALIHSINLAPDSVDAAPIIKTFPQPIIGFGCSFMRSGAMLFNQLTSETQDQLMKDLFDPKSGARFTVGKLSVAASAFMPPTWYSYHDDQRGNFTIGHDLTDANGTIPFAKRAFVVAASAGGGAGSVDAIKIESSMDYPPQWMLADNGANLPGAQVNSSFYPQLAQYFVDFFTAFETAGVPIAFLDCFNEPLESYLNMTQAQIADFMKNFMGPMIQKMRKEGKRTPLLSWGAQHGRSISKTDWMEFVTSDADLLQYLDFFAVHGYDGKFVCDEINSPPSIVNGWNTSSIPGLASAEVDFKTFIDTFAANQQQQDKNKKPSFPSLYGKPTLMTEVSYCAIEFGNYPSNSSLCPNLPRVDFLDSMQWGRMLFGDLGAGAAGWIYGNLLLDTEGGPYLFSPSHNDQKNNFQQPIVVVDTSSDSYTLSGVYFAMAHFSKWVLPGMSKVENLIKSSDLPENVHAIAFVNNNNSESFGNKNNNSNNNCHFVVVLMNDRSQDIEISLSLFGYAYSTSNRLTLPAVSFTTIEFFANGTLQNVTVSGNSNNNNNGNKDDELRQGWEGPVLGTIFSLLFVAIVSTSFMRKLEREDKNINNNVEEEETAETNENLAGGSSAATREGDYKSMA